MKKGDHPPGTVAERLKELGATRVLIQMANNGQLLKLTCEMPTCYCPKGASTSILGPIRDTRPNASGHQAPTITRP